MGKVKNQPKSLFDALNGLPYDMPFELVKAIASWNTIIKSPYGHSYYDTEVDWGVKPHGSLRIADHWNFSSNFKMHCQTTEPVPNNHYTIASFDAIINRYVPIASYPKQAFVKQTFEYRLLHTEVTRERAIIHQNAALEGNPLKAEYQLRSEIEYMEKLCKLFGKFIK